MLTDADVVLPVGCAQPDRATGYYGIHTILYPEFSDIKTQARFRRHDRFGDNAHHRQLRHEVNHVAWLLGVNFTVQIVPAAGDGILHVLAGQSDAVRRECRELYRAAWTWPVAQRAELVIAAIEGGPPHQTWENLGRVLESAGRLVEDGGAIAVCCELAAAPGAGAATPERACPSARQPCGKSAARIPATRCPRSNWPEPSSCIAFIFSAGWTLNWWRGWK